MVKRNVLAVSGACMAFSRALVERIGYLDERFTMCGSDVEFCIRASQAGLWNVYDPGVRLVHHEACTRKSRPIPENDFALSRQVYGPYLCGRGDPFYNPHLSLMDTTPMVLFP
jgi:GT2 family glycosyltransferase